MMATDPVFQALGMLQQADVTGQSAAAAASVGAAHPGYPGSNVFPQTYPGYLPPAPAWVYAHAAAAAAAAAASYHSGCGIPTALQGAASGPLLLPDVLPSDRSTSASSLGDLSPTSPAVRASATHAGLPMWTQPAWQYANGGVNAPDLPLQGSASPTKTSHEPPKNSSPDHAAQAAGASPEPQPRSSPSDAPPTPVSGCEKIELNLAERTSPPASLECTPAKLTSEPMEGLAKQGAPVSLMLATPPPRSLLSSFRADAPAFVPGTPLAPAGLEDTPNTGQPPVSAATSIVEARYETPAKAEQSFAGSFVEARAQMLRVRKVMTDREKAGVAVESPVRFGTIARKPQETDATEQQWDSVCAQTPVRSMSSEQTAASQHLLQLVKGDVPSPGLMTPQRARRTPGGPKVIKARVGEQPVPSPPKWSPGLGHPREMPVAPATPPPPIMRAMQTPSPPAASPDWSGRGRRPDSAASASAAAALSAMDSPQPLPPLPERSSLTASPGDDKGSGKGETRSRIRALAAAARKGIEEE
eukprot:TRINITY_DN87574_c0_g1_i1.p1 TRINITY_DN87574_c0_g1~~TRINITY_DN87574_c0_g1_i1.p1  ORF type:complete len:529 (+),score=67.76 TRINITY_DN87574_c0_g1_i1:75-1661(+)